MKALIISDSHGKNMNLDKVIKNTAPVDLIIHLGDLEGAEAYLEDIAPCPVEMVCGNNDFFTPCEKEKIIEFGKYRIFMCHGHQYSVSFGNERIKNVAMALGCDVVLYGHTHCPVIDYSTPGIIAVNPGSIAYPRQESRKLSFVLMEIDRFGELHFSLSYM